MADGSIRVNVELANDHLKAGLKEIENMISNSSKGIKKSLEQIDNSTDLILIQINQLKLFKR